MLKEAKTLTLAGYKIHIIDWKRVDANTKPYEEMNGIRISRVSLAIERIASFLKKRISRPLELQRKDQDASEQNAWVTGGKEIIEWWKKDSLVISGLSPDKPGRRDMRPEGN
jgi:hypothetical protein